MFIGMVFGREAAALGEYLAGRYIDTVISELIAEGLAEDIGSPNLQPPLEGFDHERAARFGDGGEAHVFNGQLVLAVPRADDHGVYDSVYLIDVPPGLNNRAF